MEGSMEVNEPLANTNLYVVGASLALPIPFDMVIRFQDWLSEKKRLYGNGAHIPDTVVFEYVALRGFVLAGNTETLGMQWFEAWIKETGAFDLYNEEEGVSKGLQLYRQTMDEVGMWPEGDALSDSDSDEEEGRKEKMENRKQSYLTIKL